MKENNKTAIVVAVIGAVGMIISGIGGSLVGKNSAQEEQEKHIQSQIVQIEGNNNSVEINNVDDLVKEYNNLLSENNSLKEKNTSYFNDLAETKDKLKFLEEQLGDIPQISYKSLGLVLDVQDISVNKNNSMVTIDGRDYFSREITEELLPDSKNITIKDGTIFVGTVVADKVSLYEQKIMNQSNIYMIDSIEDSYGNIYSNVLYCRSTYTNKKEIIYVLNNKYSLLKLTLAIRENANLDKKGILTIKADNQVVYTSNNLDKKTQPFTIEVAINNCKLLTLEYDCNLDNNDCIIADAILYN